MRGPDRRDERADNRDSYAYDDRPPVRGGSRPVGPLLLVLGGLLIVVGVAWLLFGRGNSSQDKLNSGNSTVARTAQPNPQKLCASAATYDLIKRELFRRAAQVRGSDQAAFDRLSAYAVLRMENPVMENDDQSGGVVSCSGSLSLDLPPGVAVVGGRQTLASEVDYSVQPAADGSGNVVLLRNAEAITTPLATLARVAQPAPVTQAPGPVAAPQQPAPAPPITQPPSAPPVRNPSATSTVPRPASARPSFNCANARTAGEIAVCSDATLAGLDRTMAAQFNRAMASASPEQQAMLRRSRERFLNYRDRCRDNRCIGDAYIGRMREIRDILEGRWQAR